MNHSWTVIYNFSLFFPFCFKKNILSRSSFARLALPLRVQQPESHHAAPVAAQPGDVLICQQPITGLHFHFAADLGQPRAGRGAQERQVKYVQRHFPLVKCHLLSTQGELLIGAGVSGQRRFETEEKYVVGSDLG